MNFALSKRGDKMTIELANMGRRELERLQDRITNQLEKLDIAHRKEALAAAQKAARAHGYELSELTGSTPKSRGSTKKRKAASRPKYANPNNRAQTWSGRGRQPQWFKDSIGSGMKPEDMAI